jgi:hypothetical protein
MFRKLVLTATAATLAATPIAAQAAPARAPSPVTAEAEALRGDTPWLGIVFFLVGAGLIALLWHDDDEGPISP